jgi:hypothetical protein
MGTSGVQALRVHRRSGPLHHASRGELRARGPWARRSLGSPRREVGRLKRRCNGRAHRATLDARTAERLIASRTGTNRMTIVMCTEHGRQSGPHCCEHVLDASYRTPPLTLTDPAAIVFATIDMLDDESVLLGVVLCGPCAAKFGRASGDVVSGTRTHDALPWICPICTPCFERWAGRPAPPTPE